MSLSLKTARVLVTGARGFLGSNVCRQLLDVGAEVYGVTRSTARSLDEGIHWLEGDLRQVETARNLLQSCRPDVVLHLAGVAEANRNSAMVLPTLQDNLVATVNLLHAVESFGDCRRLVLTASLEEPAEKTAATIAASPYAASKWAESIYAQMFHHCYGLPVVMVRPFMTYGPRQRREKLIPYTILSLLNNQNPRIGSGNRLVDWVYVDDVAEGILLAAQKENLEGRTIDLGSGVGVSIRGVVEEIENIVSSTAAPVFDTASANVAQVARLADTDSAYAALGWRARTSLSSGLKQTAGWYSANSQVLTGTGRAG